ncbi:aspartate/glutamate racemase family protein [Conexibacter sp. CPCC 206217]|uniref:aspartate/glutamate racemase family protein n=1 Tax=Conexibacter sp. CPCC 206217 TaxID=3064574 RepID=UPI002717E372|nr:aspartate/glutamate racemase family protein [Conexibacter sp. CPCC 206217]MDO8212624.1 aspartate/glutamate racemase family protein [Conexibacter sp. CPCC 206217]
MDPFRLGLLNPNSSEADTAAMAALIAPSLPGGAVLERFTARDGHAAIEGEAEHADAAVEVLRMIRAAPQLDAYLIGCFDDPGLHAARELTRAPVVGIGEAAYGAAALVGRRFAVITTLRRGVAAIEDGLAAKGLRDRCAGVLALERGVERQREADAADAIAALGRDAVERLGADALVLACGAMAASGADVSRRLGVPVSDGVAFGALTAHALWRTGMRTSKANAYGWPGR